MGTNVSTNYITCPADANKTLGIKLPFLVMIIKNVSIRCSLINILFGYSWKNISHSRSKFLMIRMWEEDSEHQTIRVPLESSHLYALCQWDLMKAGTRSSSTCLISLEELMVLTILKRLGKYLTIEYFKSLTTLIFYIEFNYMLTAEWEEFTSQTDFTLKMSYLQNLNYSCQLLGKHNLCDDLLFMTRT